MSKTLTDQTIALAGLTQAVQLVRNIARNGSADDEDLETCLSSLLKINADSVEDVYGGLKKLKNGLSLLERQLGDPETVDTEMARYAAALVYLESKYQKQPTMQKTVRAGLERATTQAAHFSVIHENVLSNLAEVYQNSISQLAPRIVVVGEQRFLENPANANKIRALLLAGIRSAWLWRQCGGGRLGFLLNRRKLREEAKRLSQAVPLGFRDSD
ncbi:MAG: high frequency lysogenization protein HflD [Candidatus Methylumidiphilus sp.]